MHPCRPGLIAAQCSLVVDRFVCCTAVNWDTPSSRQLNGQFQRAPNAVQHVKVQHGLRVSEDKQHMPKCKAVKVNPSQ